VRGGLGGTNTFVLLPVLLLAFARTVVGGMTFGTSFEGAAGDLPGTEKLKLKSESMAATQPT
jgi:hypothetical protein